MPSRRSSLVEWWQEWVGENQISRNNPIGEEAPRTKFGILNEEIIFMKEESYEKSSITTGTQTSSERSAKSEGQDTQYGAKN